MTMYALIVEDDLDFVEALCQLFSDLPGNIEVKVAGSRNEAHELLDNCFFDLIILDLNIPTIKGSLDANPEHGNTIFAIAQTIAPGTPVFVLTGSPAEDFFPAMLRRKQQIDIWGEGREVQSIDFLKKYQFDQCAEMIQPIATAVRLLSAVELEQGELTLSIEEDRLIRIFARRFRGVRARVSPINGGLSGAKVFRIQLTNSEGVRIHDSIAKLGSIAQIRSESERFDSIIVRLEPGATPRKLLTLKFGARALAGIFYGLAEGFNSSIFDLALCRDGRASAAIRGVVAVTRRWTANVPETRRPLREVRRRTMDDETFETIVGLYSIDWVRNFEANDIQTRWTDIHGDLHGKNVLVSDNGTVVLIDYGDVGQGPASLDPITMELSLLFHQDKVDLGGWPPLDLAQQWGSPITYFKDCPAAEFGRSCREWAGHVSAGNREVAASAYAYLIRQLKYKDTDKDLALALLNGVRSFYQFT